MKTLKRLTFTSLIMALLLASCAVFRVVDLNKLSVGMNEQAAYQAIGLKPDNTIVVKQYPQRTLKVVEYSVHVANPNINSNRPERDWLYFFNGKLVQYGRPGNLEEESEHIVSVQSRK